MDATTYFFISIDQFHIDLLLVVIRRMRAGSKVSGLSNGKEPVKVSATCQQQEAETRCKGYTFPSSSDNTDVASNVK